MTTISSVNDCRVIVLPQHDDSRGSLTVLERLTEIPFDVRRTFLIAGVPSGATRGHHANMLTSELIVCAAGAMTVRLEDEHRSRSIPMSSRSGAVLVPPGLWVELRDFSRGAVVVVLADTDYRDASRAYIRDRNAWLASRRVARVA